MTEYATLLTVIVGMIVVFASGMSIGYMWGFKSMLHEMRENSLLSKVENKKRGRPPKKKK